MANIKDIVVENAQIVFRNFSGKQGRFNAEGNRNFCLLLDHDLAEALAEDGWNVKFLTPRDEEEEPRPYLQVSLRFDIMPPKIYLIVGNKKTKLEEDSVNVLDFAEIENVDLVVRPYAWEVSGRNGLKAYVKSMYVTIVKDEFADKYADVPDSAVTSVDFEPFT